jgi:hypothetical protein
MTQRTIVLMTEEEKDLTKVSSDSIESSHRESVGTSLKGKKITFKEPTIGSLPSTKKIQIGVKMKIKK